jgi:hypothetical protein
MLRRLFTLLSPLSLLLCVAASVLWVRSRYVGEVLRCDYGDDGRSRLNRASLQIGSGRLRLSDTRVVAHDAEFYREVVEPLKRGPLYEREPPELIRRSDEYEANELPPALGALGFGYARFAVLDAPVAHFESWGVVVPIWSLVALALPLPLLWLAWRIRRRRLTSRGRCSQCGYDLRATPGRCPECGTAAAGKDA